LKNKRERGENEIDMILEKEEEDEYYDFSDDIFACMTVTIGGI
jgi:hypothetical protein